MRLLLAYLLSLCCFVLLPQTARAQATTLDDAPVVTLDHGQIEFLRDPSGTLSIDEARDAAAQGRFRPLAGNLGLGYSPDAVWLRLALERPADRPVHRWLEVMPPYLDDIRLFHVVPSGTVGTRRGGDFLPQSAKELDYRGTLFKLDLEPGRHEIYLRLQTTSSLSAIVKLWQPDAFERHQRTSYFAFGLYFSLILAVLVFNAANWLVSRRPIFIVYVGYLLLNALQWLAINGLVAEFIFPTQPLLANLTLGMTLSLAAAMAFGFYIMVLELKRHHPVLYRISLAGMALSLVTALATPLGYYGVFAPWLLAFAIVSLCGMPWPVRRLWATGDLWARLLAMAYLAYGALVGINILGVLAILPFGEPIHFAGMASNIAHILLLHFAILLHYRRIEADHAAALEKSVLAERQVQLEKMHREEQDKLLAMITHEIRTPVAVIDAATQTLAALDETPDTDREERYDRIRRSVNRLTVLLDLAVAQEYTHVAEWRLEQAAIAPVRLVADVADLLGRPLADRLRIEAAEGLPAIEGDARMLRFALLNLVDNACKYSPENLPVAIRIAARDEAGRPGVAWEIEDGGPGIPPDMEEKIFEKYVRAGEAGHRGGEAGLGLGLYLARHIVERHGGRLHAEPGRTQGACFVCWLPAKAKEGLA